MTRQIIFIIFTLVALGCFGYTISRIIRLLKLTQKAYPLDQIPKRIMLTLSVAFGQTKIFRKPLVGFAHALVFWGFLVITIGTAEIMLDGCINKIRILSFLGPVYDLITASGDIFAVLVLLCCLIFLFRRFFLTIKRFSGIELKVKSKIDATIALTLIMILMLSLLGLNMGYVGSNPENYHGAFPVSKLLVPYISHLSASSMHNFEQANWWMHIIIVMLFLNILPYSKHFHVILSIPNVFLSRLDSLTKMSDMPAVTKEVKLMLNPDTASPPEGGEEELSKGETVPTPQEVESVAEPGRFGVKDVEDVSWKNYVDALSCTECGRCTAVCPANITGKKLSPRKLFVDLRKRMNEKGPRLVKEGMDFSDNKSLLGDYITAEELWACTTCNACAQECPVNIDQPSLILDMRRYLVMEESAAPSQLNTMFSNIENNGAPWAFAQSERMNWAEEIYISIGD
ncbi:MAG: (Fe-S)-binding protein [Cytophagales bacterium]|nr:(Fe-S)-binding protein [Cytophagales bacterium]